MRSFNEVSLLKNLDDNALAYQFRTVPVYLRLSAILLYTSVADPHHLYVTPASERRNDAAPAPFPWLVWCKITQYLYALFNCFMQMLP
jgi:hypothetical protein